MKYCDFIQQEKEFTRSANVQFDITNDRKLARFIPNETTVKLFKDYFVSISTQSGNHSKQLHGSYGTGKSHFLTVLSNVLAHQNTAGLAFDTFTDRIARYDEDLAADVKSFVRIAKPFLIVPITFDFKDFNRCIIFSLQKVLEEKKIRVKLKNFFIKALEVVDLWQKENESKQKLLKFCEEKKITLETFIGELKRYNNQYETLFKEVFSFLSYGVEFVPEQTNLISTIDEIRKAIDANYQGIVFIFDEFGRYFEENARSLRISEVQTLAEYCNNTKMGNYVIFVTHKELSQYTSEMSESAANEWRKVEGRFEATSINDKRDQCLSLISNILIKNNEAWGKFTKLRKNDFDNLKGQVADFKGFLIADIEHDPVEISYPLHPIALYVLDRLSKKIAQNERTFFTYLASETENSIYDFLNKKDTEKDRFCFVGLDLLFDYFEQNLKTVRSDSSYQIYKAYQRALNKVVADKTVEMAILKAIAIISIVDEFQVLSPSRKLIVDLIDYDKDEISYALDILVTQKILKYSRVYKYYEFFDASSVDIEERVKQNFETIADEAVIDILSKEFSDFVLWSYTYNNTYKMQRAFLPHYIDLNAAKKNAWIKKLPEYYDGLLCLALNGNGDAEDVIQKLSIDVPRSIFIANSSSRALFNEAKKYLAILLLDNNSDELVKEDPLAKKEIAYYKNEQHQILSNKINELLNVFDDCNRVYVDGALRHDISSFDDLTMVADEIMTNTYPHALIVNNELLNKNNTTGAMNTAKKKAIEGMLFIDVANDEVYAGLQLMSPEYNCIRSVLTRNCFIQDPDIINLPDLTVRNAMSVKKELDKYVKQISINAINLSALVDILRAPPYGLRTGYLSILIANMIKPHLNNLTIIFGGAEQEITPQLIEDVVQRPELYKFSINDWNEIQREYINKIEALFSEFIRIKKTSINRLKAIYEAMNAHYKSISKYVRATNSVSDMTKRYRMLIEQTHKDYNNFFFNEINTLAEDYETVYIILKTVKDELDVALSKLRDYLIKQVKLVFSNGNLATGLTDFANEYRDKLDVIYGFHTNSFISVVKKIDLKDTDESLVDKLAKAIVGIEISYWNDSQVKEFSSKLIEIKNEIIARSIIGKNSELGEVEIQITQAEKKKKLVFNSIEVGVHGETMRNKLLSVLDSFGQSVPYNERVQIILSILNETTLKE